MAVKKSSDADQTNLEETKQQSPKDEPHPEPAASEDDLVTQKVQQVLKEHGIDATTMDSMGQQVLEELVTLQKEKPLVLLLGAFALGCVVGRAFK